MDTDLIQIGESNFKAVISSKFSIGDAPNGGYLMALAISAATSSQPFTEPLSVNGHYVAKTSEGVEADIDVRVLNVAKTSSCVEVSVTQENKLRCKFVGTFVDRSAIKGMTMIQEKAPDISPVAECVDANKAIRKAFGDHLKIANTFDMMIPSSSAFAKTTLVGATGDSASMEGWMRFSDGKMPCINSLAFFSDCAPPPILNVSAFQWVPTVEYTVHFWNDPARVSDSPWLRMKFGTTFVQNGILYTDGELWSENGQYLLAKSRQVARLIKQR